MQVREVSPETLWHKFSYYARKYGAIHASLSYLGRRHLGLWRVIGPMATRGQIRRWSAASEARILNLGGGSNCIAGCLTVDIDPRADAYVDVTKPLPFEDESVDAILCEEVIEHVSRIQGKLLLDECLRILVPGGILRLTTPDLNWHAEQLLSGTIHCDEVNEVFYGHGHRYLYTREALQRCCLEAGFTEVRTSSYRDEASVLGYLDSHAERFNHPPEISQFLEVAKPRVPR